jgi:hypothetical protein
MDVSVAFNASDLKQLQAVLGPQIDANNVAVLIAKIGAQEALDQAIGRGAYKAMVDQRQHRVKELLLGGASTSRKLKLSLLHCLKSRPLPPSGSLKQQLRDLMSN